MLKRISTSFFFFLAFMLLVIACKSQSSKRVDRQKASLLTHIGQKFSLANILDSTGKITEPDFTQSDITIIDLWFNTCPPCIAEMKQFEQLLPGKEKKVSVISISINNFALWKKTLQEHSGKFSFLAAGFSNWKHFVLGSSQDEKLKNAVSADRVEQLREQYDVQFYPAYFVVDKNGIILARPASATKFIMEYK